MSRLLDQVRDVIRTRHYSIRTEEAYLNWIREYRQTAKQGQTIISSRKHPDRPSSPATPGQ